MKLPCICPIILGYTDIHVMKSTYCPANCFLDQMREKTLRDQIESTFKQLDTAGTELECFRALQKQEQLAASHRINSLWEEVQKQKELERTLQIRYGALVAELERARHLFDGYRAEAQKQEEIAANNRASEIANAATNQAVPSNQTEEIEDPTDSCQSLDGNPGQESHAAENAHADDRNVSTAASSEGPVDMEDEKPHEVLAGTELIAESTEQVVVDSTMSKEKLDVEDQDPAMEMRNSDGPVTEQIECGSTTPPHGSRLVNENSVPISSDEERSV